MGERNGCKEEKSENQGKDWRVAGRGKMKTERREEMGKEMGKVVIKCYEF